jgi:hypothetical protein
MRQVRQDCAAWNCYGPLRTPPPQFSGIKVAWQAARAGGLMQPLMQAITQPFHGCPAGKTDVGHGKGPIK